MKMLNLNSIKISIEFVAQGYGHSQNKLRRKLKEKVVQQKNLRPCLVFHHKILHLKEVDRGVITLPSKHSAVSKVSCLAAKSRVQRK